jgi:hypothetical protein
VIKNTFPNESLKCRLEGNICGRNQDGHGRRSYAGNKSVSYLVYIVSNSGMMHDEFSGHGLTEIQISALAGRD